ncbi:MAG: lysophospholipase [Anaerolineae bacterium]|jgi:alpha-beta hydrolase superfamily lysophospholipase
MDQLTFEGCGGLELYCRRWRSETEPKAVLSIVHGHGEHSGRYENVVDWFVPRGYTVYAFDLRGHGHSQGTRGALDDFGEFREDLHAFLDLVREAEQAPIFLAGHSLGGLIALNYVLHDRSGLAGVVASGPVLSPPGLSPFLLWLSKVLDRVWPGLILDSGLDTSALSRDAAVVQAYVNDPLVHSKGSVRMANEMLRAVEWTQAHAAELALPCLIVHGGEDRLCDPQASKRFYDKVTAAGKEYIEYEGYFHEVYNDLGKEKVFADVQAWLERHLPANGEATLAG